VELRQLIRSGITASAIVHLSFLMLVIFFSEVHPFGAVKVEPIAVDLVTPQEAAEKKKPDPETEPSNSFDLPAASAASSPPPSDSSPPAAAEAAVAQTASAQPAAAQPAPPQPAPPQPAAQPETQAAISLPPPTPPPVAQPQPQPQLPSAPPPATSPSTTYVPAQPDLSVKYQVMLGLPQNPLGDGFDAMATQTANIASDLVTEFRNHVKTCATLPKSIAPSDKVAIKLRVLMTPEGRLAAEPILIEASASAKGPILMQSAIQALQACQPYAMLPAARYGEWKKLDLSFTPRDFTGAS
jgi:hypothetical protein